MKLDLAASWGYPVLRPNSDDYVNCEFQSSIKLFISDDLNDISTSYEVDISVPEIQLLLAEKRASCLIYVHCRNTWYGEVFSLDGPKGEFKLPKSHIEGDTNFWTLVVATEAIPKYRSSKFHPEYDQAVFSIEQDQILAIAEPESHYISRDMFKSVTSLFDYSRNNNLSEGEWRVDIEGNRLVIEANDAQVRYFRSAENTRQGQSVVLNAVFLPALLQVINSFRDAPGQYEEKRWAQVLMNRLEEAKLAHSEPLAAAQGLLRKPTTWLNKNMKWRDDEA